MSCQPPNTTDNPPDKLSTNTSIFFWKTAGTKGVLSQWHSSPFIVDETPYNCAEQYMMAAKAALFHDSDARAAILATDNPRDMKECGRAVTNFRDDVWEKHRFDIVVRGNYAKFTQNVEMGRYLMQTGDKILVEASPYDRVWGIGLAEERKEAMYPHKWKGMNLLGKALMEVRRKMKEENWEEKVQNEDEGRDA